MLAYSMEMPEEIIISGASEYCAEDRFDDVETEDGLLLRILNIQFDEDTSLEAPIDRVGLSCVLEGSFEGHVDGLPDLVGDSSQLRVFYWTGAKSIHLSYPAGTHLRCVQLLISPDYIEKHLAVKAGVVPELLLSALNSEEGGYYMDQRRLQPALRVVAEQVMRCPLTGPLRDKFYHGKALELLALGFSDLHTEEPSKQAMLLSVSDVERVREARDILLADRVSPPTLAQLSRMVGLNEFKLKQGFRFVFNTTAFALLNMDRMEEAERLLREGRLNVAQVGYKVGYASNAAFSRAFRRCFGYPPSAILRNSALENDPDDDE
ncbi:MAG: AraC family transcriptional regulator [Pseudomonadota bacterium]